LFWPKCLQHHRNNKRKTPAKCLTWQGFSMVAEEGFEPPTQGL
jgi:hypothetical protein